MSAKEDALPAHAGLYTLPSMQFLESLLEEMDSRRASIGCSPAEPPLYLPIESFDLADTAPRHRPAASLLAPPTAAPRQLPPPRQPAALAAAHTHRPAPPPAFPGFGGFIPVAPTAGSAAPSPQRGASHVRAAAAAARRATSALAELYELDEDEAGEGAMHAAKAAPRPRKTSSFAGAKRKLGELGGQGAAPAPLAAGPAGAAPGHGNAVSESGAASGEDDDSGDDVSKASRRTSKSECALLCSGAQEGEGRVWSWCRAGRTLGAARCGAPAWRPAAC
jgi:hypothetical protein